MIGIARSVLLLTAAGLSGCIQSLQPLVEERDAVTPLETGFYQDCELSASDDPIGCRQLHVIADEQRRYRAIQVYDTMKLLTIAAGDGGAGYVVQLEDKPGQVIYGVAGKTGDDWLAIFPQCSDMPAVERERLVAAHMIRPTGTSSCVFRTLQGVRAYLRGIAVDKANRAPLVATAKRHVLHRQPSNAAFLAETRTEFANAVRSGSWKTAVAIVGLHERRDYDAALRLELETGLRQAMPQLGAWVARQTGKDRTEALIVQGWASVLIGRQPDVAVMKGVSDEQAGAEGLVMILTATARSPADPIAWCRNAEQLEMILPVLQWPLDDWLRTARSTLRCG